MEIQHISYSKQASESLSKFISRIAGELAKLEVKSEVKDLLFDFPDDETANPYTTVTIYYSSSDKKSYTMKSRIFASTSDNTAHALLNVDDSVKAWIKSVNIQPYDVKTTLLIDEAGDDVAKVAIYYDDDTPKEASRN